MHALRIAALFVAMVPAGYSIAGEPSAPEGPARDDSPLHRWGLKGGIGFTADPGAFLMGFEGEYAFLREFRVGPLFQVATNDDTTIFAPTLNAKFVLPTHEHRGDLNRLEPFVQGGIGLAYVEKERGGRDHDDTGFLMNAGFGCDYMLNDHFGVGTSMLFNVLPHETEHERFFFSWQVVTVSVRF